MPANSFHTVFKQFSQFSCRGCQNQLRICSGVRFPSNVVRDYDRIVASKTYRVSIVATRSNRVGNDSDEHYNYYHVLASRPGRLGRMVGFGCTKNDRRASVRTFCHNPPTTCKMKGPLYESALRSARSITFVPCPRKLKLLHLLVHGAANSETPYSVDGLNNQKEPDLEKPFSCSPPAPLNQCWRADLFILPFRSFSPVGGGEQNFQHWFGGAGGYTRNTE